MSGQVRTDISLVTSCQDMSVMSVQVMSAHFKFSSGHVKAGRGPSCQTKSGHVWSSQVNSGQVESCVAKIRSGHVRSGQVMSDQFMFS